MKPRIAINIVSPRDLVDKQEGRAIFELLGRTAPNLVPDRYNLVEPINKPFTLDNLDAIMEEWDRGFLWKRKKPKSNGSAWLAISNRPVHSWITFGIDQYIKEIEPTVAAFRELCAHVEADFASLQLVTERDVERGKANGTFSFNNVQHTSYSHFVFTFQLQKNIPDLYWGTVLGRPYVELFGRDRILSAPAAIVEELAENIFYLQLTDDIRDLETRFDEVEAVRQAIKEHLGSDAFFDETLGPDHTYRVPFFPLNGRNTGEPPAPVPEDLADEELLSKALVPLALEHLQELGTFDPFAAMVNPDRTVGMLGFAPEPGNHQAMIELIQGSLRAFIQERKLRAVAVCADVEVIADPATGDSGKALQFIYEDASGEAYTMYLPYVWDEAGELQFSSSQVIGREPVLFTAVAE